MLIALLAVLGVDLIVLVFLISSFAAPPPGLISNQKVLEILALSGPTGAC